AAQFEIVDLTDLPLAELKKRLAVLSDNTAVIYTGIYYTSEGISYVPAELVSRIAEWANRPLVVDRSVYLNKGAIGGNIVRAMLIGEQAAHIALRILGGESASDIPVVKVPRKDRENVKAILLPDARYTKLDLAARRRNRCSKCMKWP